MTAKVYRGDSIPVAEVVKLTPSNVVTGDTFTVTCNGKSISYVSVTGTGADVVNGLAAAITANAAGIPEFTEFTALAVPASTPGANDGSTLLLTAGTAGLPFKVTTSTLVTTAGNITVVETTQGKNAVNEVHQISLVGTYTGGTFTITYSFGTTSALAYNATAAQVQTALAALAGVGVGQVLVTGGPGPNSPWFVTWTGTLAGTAVATGTINGGSLTGNGSVVISEQQQGHGASNEIQCYTLETCTAGTYTITWNGQTTAPIAFNAGIAVVQTALANLPNIGAGNVAVYGLGGGTGFNNADYYFVVFQGALAGTNVSQMVLNTGNLVFGVFLAPIVQTLQNGGQSTSDDFQVIDLGGATGGQLTLTYNGQTSGFVNVVPVANGNGSFASQMRTAIAQITGLNAQSDIVVFDSWQGGLSSATGFEEGQIPVKNCLVHFTGAAANTAMQLLQVNGGGLTGSSGQTVTRISTGHASLNEIWNVYCLATGGTFTLTLNSQTTIATAFNATTGTLQTNIQNAFTNSLTTVSVSGSGTLAAPWVITVTNPANTALGPPTGNGALLTGGGGTIVELTHGAAGINEVQTVTIAAGVTGGTFTLAFNGATTGSIAFNATNGTVQTALTGLSTINTVTVGGSAGGPWTVTWSGVQGSAPQPLLVGNGGNLTGFTGTQALALTTVTPSSGPFHYNDPNNWSPVGVPGALDTVYFEQGSANCLYGLNQISTFTWNTGTNLGTWAAADLIANQAVFVSSTGTLPSPLTAGTTYYLVTVNADAGTFQLATTPNGTPITVTTVGTGVHTVGVRLASLELNSRWTGQLGSSQQNSLNYFEYRPIYLHVGFATVSQGGQQTLTVGTGNGSGSGQQQFDTDIDQVAVKVIATSGSTQPGIPAMLWKGQHAANTLNVISGVVGSALFPGETALLASIVQRGGAIELGPGVSLTGPIDKIGGTLISDGATINGTCLVR